MPIDHNEINEKIDKLKLQQLIVEKESLLNEAKNKKSPDARLIEQLEGQKKQFKQQLDSVEQAIRQRSNLKVR